MNLWSILATGGVGLGAGQIGAWLQSRRDASADHRRHLAETERLRLQLADGRERQSQDRDYRDLLEWRERRLAVYQDASTALDGVTAASYEFTYHKGAETVTAALSRMKAAGAILDAKLDQCAIIGTNDTRSSALTVQMILDDLLYAAGRYESYVSTLSSDPDRGPQLLARIASEKRRRLGTNQPPPSEPEYLAVAKLASAFAVPDDKFLEAGEEWRAAVRAELGVPS